MGKSPKQKLEHLQTYVTKNTREKADTRWRNLGYISESDYLRDLVISDLKNN